MIEIIALGSLALALLSLWIMLTERRFLTKQVERSADAADRANDRLAQLVEELPKTINPWLLAAKMPTTKHVTTSPEERAASVDSVISDGARAEMKRRLMLDGSTSEQAEAAIADAMSQLKGGIG